MNTTIRIFLLVVGNALALVLGCLALATTATNVLGWFLLLVSIVYGVVGAFTIWLSREEDPQQQAKLGSRSFWPILPGFLVAFVAPPLEYLYLPGLLPHGVAVQATGVTILLLGTSLLVWARLTLERSHFGYMRVTRRRRVEKEGPYRLVRHPDYAGFLLVALGLAVGYSSLIGLVAVPVLMLPGLIIRMRAEEQVLIETFGDEYRTYARTTKRLVPGLW